MLTIFFDLETTDVDIETAEITQFAAIAMDGDREIGTFERLVKFDESKASPEALKINHYDRDRWAKEAKPATDAIVDFTQARVSKAGRPYKVGTLCGYNAARFDFPILQRHAKAGDVFLPFDLRVRDAMAVAMSVCDFLGACPQDFKLSTMADHFGVEVAKAHDALSDVRTTIGLMRRFREFFVVGKAA